ncbi:MAG: hypothetical protein ACRD0D_15385, partial [Acidimicrobiales bacterium]
MPGRLPAGEPTRLWYVDGGEHLGRIADPGGAATDFVWASCKLHRVRTPLMNDAVAAGVVPNDAVHWAQFDYGGGLEDGRVESVLLPPPVGGAVRPARSYTSPAPGETRVSVAGVAEPLGFSRQVTFDTHGRLVTDTDGTAMTTTYEWDTATLHEQPPPDRPPLGPARLRSVTDATGLRTTTLYESGLGHLFAGPMATDTYGPAPASWFGADGRPLGAHDPDVAHRESVFDQAMAGLAATYWDNPTLTGAPVAMDLGVAGPGGALDRDWGTGSPAAGIGTDDWSAAFTGN